LLDVQVTPKACGASRWVDPTAMVFSAWAGSVIEPSAATAFSLSAPALPAETTTSTPESTSWFTAWDSGERPAA
jgi:hypothetical protein